MPADDDDEELDELTKKLREKGCAPKTPSTPDKEDGEELVLPIKGMAANGFMRKASPMYTL